MTPTSVFTVRGILRQILKGGECRINHIIIILLQIRNPLPNKLTELYEKYNSASPLCSPVCTIAVQLSQNVEMFFR